MSKTPHSSFMVDDDVHSKMITLTGSETLVLFLEERIKPTEVISNRRRPKGYEVNFVLDNLVIEPELWLS